MSSTDRDDPGYDVRSYWSRVGTEIAARSGNNVIAGDDDAYFRYKRQRFLSRFLHAIDFDGRSVLEIGFGPGGNLVEIASRHRPRALLGADISPVMAELAGRNLARHGVRADLRVIDGRRLPFADRSVDLTFTVTVLQHNTDGAALADLVAEIGRVSRERVILMEDIGNEGRDGRGTWAGRRVAVYQELFEPHGFRLGACQFLATSASERTHGLISRGFWSKRHREGEPLGRLPRGLIAAALPLARIADDLLPARTGLAKLTFERAE